MSNFPGSLDDDTTLPFVNNNINEIGGDAINALRDAVFALEQNVGIGAAGTTNSLAQRINGVITPGGTLAASAITGLGLVTLPITQDQIANWAQIPESKLKLDHRTQDLFNYVRDLASDVNTALGWISVSGVKLEPHLSGALYQHTLNQINVSPNVALSPLLNNVFRQARDNTNAYTLLSDMNNELVTHQWADGTPLSNAQNIITNGGNVFPSSYAHTSSGIFLNTARFTTIPQTANDLQQFAQFIDSASIFLLGSRIQNLYSNGIPRESRSSSLLIDGYGSSLIPVTPVIAYLKGIGTSSSPIDDINIGDDIIEFKPSAADQGSNVFDAKFALVRVGDIVRINYGSVEVPFVIKEKRYTQNSGVKKYLVRIAGKNLFYSANAFARIDRPLINVNKYGVLAVAAADNGVPALPSSLIIGSPRGAQALGIGFNPDQFDASHYMLYLVMYPTGTPTDGSVTLPGIDVTGNQGATPGSYTLDSVVATANNAFRQVGYNYRFIAFEYQGNFGIMLADSYNNASFSIISAVVASGGAFDPTATSNNYPNNVVGMFPVAVPAGSTAPDPLGLGPFGANVASPPFQATYPSAEASQIPTQIFAPLKRNNYYVNGIEREKANLDVGQVLDVYGDGYWVATVQAQSVIPGPSPSGRVQTTYRVPLDLSASGLKIGKTLVTLSLDGYGGNQTDFGRFIIQSVNFSIACPPLTTTSYTDITVYDAVHGTALSPVPTITLGSQVAVYFGPDSVSINQESATDTTAVTPFKRHIEIYVDQNGNSFTHERGRVNAGGVSPLTINGNVPLNNYSELAKLDIMAISPKLRGYQFGSVSKITLNIVSYDTTSGVYDGYLASWDGTNPMTHQGPTTFGKKGEVVRFYDETNIDFIDVLFDINTGVGSFTNKQLDFQLFPSLSLDHEVMLIATCQYNDVNTSVSRLVDHRQFGNISEKDLSLSALQLMSLPERLLQGNGVIRGFDLEITTNPNAGQIYLTGGEALVNGNFLQISPQTVVIPTLKEFPNFNVNWILCLNQQGEYQPIPLLDFDSVLATPNNPTRLFQALNLINGQNYFLDASLFSDVVNLRKDLVPLYMIAATTTLGPPPTISLVLTDARRYVNDVNNNLPLRFTSAASQGNFKSLSSVLNWLRYNNTFNGNVFLRGLTGSAGTVSAAYNLAFGSSVIIDGENQAALTMDAPIGLGSNVTFKNLSMTFNGSVTGAIPSVFAINPVNNLTMQNCTIVININSAQGPTATVGAGAVFDLLNSNNISFIDCNITINYNATIGANYDPPTPADISSYGSIFRLVNVTDFSMIDSTMSVMFNNVAPGTFVPGDVFELINSPGVTIDSCVFTGNFNRLIGSGSSKFIGSGPSSSLHVTNTSVTSTFNPNIAGTPDFGFSTSDVVNSGQGYVYINVDSAWNDIVLDGVTFAYNPAGDPSVANTSYRFSFINIEFSKNNATLSGLRIVNCKFNNLNVSTLDDLRPAVAIINANLHYSSQVGTASTPQPLLINAVIANNTCNRNQSIIATSVTSTDGYMVYPGLAAQNCAIKNNVCGQIGYWVSSGSPVTSLPGTGIPTIYNDKKNSLVIENNTCHLINSVDHEGRYFLVSQMVNPAGRILNNQCKYPSGDVVIRDNNTNFIHTGISYEEDSSLQILNNKLTAYDPYYYLNLGEFGPNVYTFLTRNIGQVSDNILDATGYAISVIGNQPVFNFQRTSTTGVPFVGNDSSVLIDGNTTSTGFWLQTNNNPSFVWNYTGYILCAASCLITNNTLKGAALGAGDLIVVGGLEGNIIQGNKIYKAPNGGSCTSYVNRMVFSVGDLTQTLFGIITNNIFDSPYIDSLGTITTVVPFLYNVANAWVVTQNINQTGTAVVSFLNQIGTTTSGVTFPSVDAQVSLEQGADVGAPFVNPPFSATFYLGRSQFLRIVSADGYGHHNVSAQENIEKFLPTNVTIIKLEAGMKIWGTTTVLGDSSFVMNISSLNQFSPATTGIDYTNTDVAFPSGGGFTGPDLSLTELSPVYSIITSTVANAGVNTNLSQSINLEAYTDPISLVPAGYIASNYVTGKGLGITVSISLYWKIAANGPLNLTHSPVRVTYRWV